jgi:hypothetical protein
MLRAAVPETTVDEHGKPRARKNDVDTDHTTVQPDARVFAEAVTTPV